MAKKHTLTQVQKDVLTHMAKGNRLFSAYPTGGNWLENGSIVEGRPAMVHTTTLWALRKHGYIHKVDERKKWNRVDYEITEKGKEALDVNS